MTNYQETIKLKSAEIIKLKSAAIKRTGTILRIRKTFTMKTDMPKLSR